MTLPKETVATDADVPICDTCGERPKLGVQHSNAGYYIGYACCSPYSRESGYFKSREQAQNLLDKGTWWQVSGRV